MVHWEGWLLISDRIRCGQVKEWLGDHFYEGEEEEEEFQRVKAAAKIAKAKAANKAKREATKKEGKGQKDDL